MADESMSRRSRWWVLALLLAVGGWWAYRSVRPRPALAAPAAPCCSPAASWPSVVSPAAVAPTENPAAPASGTAPTPAGTDRATEVPTVAEPAAAGPVGGPVVVGTPVAEPVAAEPAGPYGPGSAHPRTDGSAPGPEYTIKGNAGSMLFHTPSSPYFGRTKPEAWFRTHEDARRAGFTEWKPKRRVR